MEQSCTVHTFMAISDVCICTEKLCCVSYLYCVFLNLFEIIPCFLNVMAIQWQSNVQIVQGNAKPAHSCIAAWRLRFSLCSTQSNSLYTHILYVYNFLHSFPHQSLLCTRATNLMGILTVNTSFISAEFPQTIILLDTVYNNWNMQSKKSISYRTAMCTTLLQFLA